MGWGFGLGVRVRVRHGRPYGPHSGKGGHVPRRVAEIRAQPGSSRWVGMKTKRSATQPSSAG